MRAKLIAVAMLTVGAGTAKAEPVRVCTTEWPPYTIGSGTAVSGIHTEAVTEAFSRLGMAVVIDSVAWDRCWREVARDTYQAIYSASWREERARVALYPETPLQSLSYVAVVRRGQVHRWDGTDPGALPQPLAAPKGYSIVEDLRGRGVAVDDDVITDAQNFRKLLAGRIATAVVERSVAAAIIGEMGIADKVEVLPQPVSAPKQYFLVVGRRAGGSEEAARDLLTRLDKVLADLAREGFIDKLAERTGPR